MTTISLTLVLAITILGNGCLGEHIEPVAPAQNNNKSEKHVLIAKTFSYPIGKKEYYTQAKDKDEWYNALEFGENAHLGEDWNKNTGGDSDCGEPVYAIADGFITYARDAGQGWGNVLIIEHTLPSGAKVESLYGHMQEILVKEGEVKKRQQIGKIGNANGRYPCHLHFEIRTTDCPAWNQPGPGYSNDRKGWVDPSDFIDSRSRPSPQ